MRLKKLSVCAILAAGLLFVLQGCSGIQTKKINSSAELPAPKVIEKLSSSIREGEKLKFSVRWLGMEVGTAEATVKGIEEIRGRKAYHIEALARSNSLIDLVYPVRDEHHTYLDTERFHSLRYEKIIQEGRYRADEVMEYDQENHTATYYSRKNKSRKQMFIAKDVKDQLAAAYWFRLQPMAVGDTVHIPTEADEKNWDLEVKILQVDEVELDKLDTFRAFQIEPMATFQGMFIRRGKIRGWISADEKRLPLMMKTKVPVLGTVTVVLVGYEGW
ncbi:MAG: hypothetical protein A3C35_00595 [Omnitrophica bacterium RIFCSPHIGHO2_02_FULL_46_11]|nr:MAG: hypothetical protein A3C35_00595 [Omnitrophica bacterium RIFCSPHIGHO2_02_FULL_46_11]OGW87644.1 MAG: hypothetical protein A3A81_04860 [Omnitrophica bacterium RIFCSPLOWO2_01_FULL_45_10b]